MKSKNIESKSEIRITIRNDLFDHNTYTSTVVYHGSYKYTDQG